MLKALIVFLTLFLPLVPAATPPEPPPAVDPVILEYRNDIEAVWSQFQTIPGDLTLFAAALIQNPELVRTPDFSRSLNLIALKILAIRKNLDEVQSPAPVEEIHEEFEDAADRFAAAALELNRFGEKHIIDDFADAFILIREGADMWRTTMDKLALMTEAP